MCFEILRAGYRCSSDKNQCSVILMHKHTSFGRILALQLLFRSADRLLFINHSWQKKRPSKNLSPLACTRAAKRMLQHISLVPEGIFSLTESMIWSFFAMKFPTGPSWKTQAVLSASPHLRFLYLNRVLVRGYPAWVCSQLTSQFIPSRDLARPNRRDDN